MKLLVLSVITLLLISPMAARAQDAMPTKEETVNYIHKKLQDVVGLERDDRCRPRCETKFTAFSFVLKGDEIEFDTQYDETYTGSRTTRERRTAVFNPAYMIEGDAAIYTCSGGKSICIKFPARIVKRFQGSDGRGYARVTGSAGNDDTVEIPLDLRVPELKSRLTRALKHLRDLAKAEDDPFGN